MVEVAHQAEDPKTDALPSSCTLRRAAVTLVLTSCLELSAKRVTPKVRVVADRLNKAM